MAFAGDDLISEALKLAGGEQSTADDVHEARRSLYLRLEELAGEQGNTWRVGRYHTSPLPSTPGIELPVDVDDVLTVSVAASLSATVPWVPVGGRITADAYARLPMKLQVGQPSSFYLERTSPPKLFLFPTGAGMAASIWYWRKTGSFNLDSNAVDAPSRMFRALSLGVALDVAAKRQPIDETLIARLERWHLDALEKAKRADRDRSNLRVRL